MPQMPTSGGALAGVRIIECAQDIAAPYAAMLLAEQGAEVLKLEPPGSDRARRLPGFHVWNRSKRSRIVDVGSAAGCAELAQLCAAADVLISDWSPHQEPLRYAALAEHNQQLIHCWMPPHGVCGDAAADAPNDDLVAARSGLLATQWAHREGPVFLTLPVASYGAAMLAAGAVCAALLARGRDGRGQQLDVSWLAGAFAMQTGSIIDHPALQRVMTMVRDPLGPIPVYRLFKASDDWLFIACGNTTFWNKLCLILERPELVSDPRFDGAPWGVASPHWPALKATVQSIIATRPRAEWLRLFAEADIPSAPVLTRADFIDDPQVRHLGMRQEIDDPTLGRTVQMGIPVTLRATPGAIRCAAPVASTAPLAFSTRPSAAPAPLVPAGCGGAPLDGVRVLDFTNYIAGPAAGMALALAGADVIKIEPAQGDPFRVFGFGFYGWNQGKRGIALDFGKTAARDLVHDLVRGADVVVENLRPGATARLGIDYATLAQLNPRLVYGSLTAFGSNGPRGHEAGFDPLLQARSGAMAAQGGHGGDPVFFACAISDYAAGLLCAFGVMAALYARQHSGRGQLVETSLAQSTMAVQSGEFIFYAGRPDLENGGPDFLGYHPLRRVYRCADGWLVVSVGHAHWPQLARLAGLAPSTITASDPTTELADGPTAHQLSAAFAARSRAAVLAELGAAKIPAAAVWTITELFSDPQITANDLISSAHAEPWGEFRQTGTLVHYGATPVTVRRRAPLLGEHGIEIARDVLGYSMARIDQLIAAGVLVVSR